MESVDVKTAFLQGKNFEKEVNIRPTKEGNTDKIWKLQKYVYGLADARRYWYLRVKELIFKFGTIINSTDQESPSGKKIMS